MSNRVRQQFPALLQRVQGLPLSYLDSAATTQKPAAVITAIQNYYRRDNANVHRAGYQLAARATEQYEQARVQVAAFFGAKPEQLIWTKGCTEAINLVAQSWGLYQLKSGDCVLMSGMEHHANLIPWQQLCRVTGATLHIIPVLENGELDVARYQELLALQPKLVAIAHVSNVLGTLNPVEQLIEMAHEAEAKVLIDGAQAAAHLAVNVQQLNADFYTFSGHKMYGPTGIGGLVAKTELLETFEPWQTGGEMVADVSYEQASWAELPHRLEAGTPHIAGAIGLAKAVAFINSLPMGWQEDEAKLLAYAKARLKALPYIELIGEASQQVAVQSFVSTQMPAQDLATYLDQQGVAVRLGKHCAHPLLHKLGYEATLRLSLACYSNQQDIEQLIQALEVAHQSNVQESEQELPAYQPEIICEQIDAAKGWQARLSLLIQLGKCLPESLKAQRLPENWVKGCESQTWLELKPLEFEAKAKQAGWCCKVDSDANVVKGVLHYLALTFNQLSPAEQKGFRGSDWLEQTGVLTQLSTTRTQGMKAVIEGLDALLDAVEV